MSPIKNQNYLSFGRDLTVFLHFGFRGHNFELNIEEEIIHLLLKSMFN